MGVGAGHGRPPRMRARLKTMRVSVAAFSVAALLLTSCGGGADAEGGGADTSEAGSLVIWADNTRKPAIEPIAEEFGEANGVEVTVIEKQLDQLRDELLTAAPAGEGPDIVIGAHDWLGQLVSAGVVAPVDLGGQESEFDEIAIEAMTFEGQLYGVPYAVENIALFRNTELVPEAPETMEEVVEIAQRLEADGEVENGFLLPTDPPDPYHNYPFFTAKGAYVFEYDLESGYDPDDLGIDSAGGIAAAEQFSEWVEAGFLKTGVPGSLMQEQFGAGEAAFAVTGPWALVQDGAGFEETGVNFEVTPIPPLDGNTPRPFVSVQGFMVSAFAGNPLVAQTFVTEATTTEEAQLAMFEANRRPPALTSAKEQIADDPVFAAFAESGAGGDPLPAIPEMSSVWEAWTNAYALIYNGDQAPKPAFEDAAEQIRSLIESE